MKLRSTLLRVAVLASGAASALAGAACSSSDTSSAATGPGPTAAKDAGGQETSTTPICGGCSCGSPAVTQGSATPAEACALARDPSRAACETFCGALNSGQTGGYYCTLPGDYQAAFQAAQDGGVDAGDAGDAGACPVLDGGTVVVQCGYLCLGRRTEGLADPAPASTASLGATFAERAYLEAVSIYAFARLERELAFHDAPPALRRDARRARRDEIRHTAMTARLARRFGASPTLPAPPAADAPRSLFAIARENAVEGCVRETYGAVMGLVEARASTDADVRRAAARIADDECRHAELARAIDGWARPRLSAAERAELDAAVNAAIAELAARGDRQVVALLEAHVWRAA